MKIHIVKKGDTLWKIAEMYDVDFEELKQMNGHLSHPDMIMPGMKIRVPVHKKETKKEHKSHKKEEKIPKKKETQKGEQKPKEQVKKPQPAKPVEEIKEDDSKDHIHIQPVIPFEQQKSPSLNMNKIPSMPSIPDLPEMAPMKEEKKEKPKEKPGKKKEEAPKKEMKKESMPLTSHGCHCYCGTCTPMHFAEDQMMPQMQQPMPMMYPSQSCGCQPPMLSGNMHQHMCGCHMHHQVQGNHMMHSMHPSQSMYHMQPPTMDPNQMYPQMSQENMHQQMMPGNMNHQMNGHDMQQPMTLPYYESNANIHGLPNEQMPQQEYIPESWQRENMQKEGDQSTKQSEEQPVRQSYPPMYSDQSAYYSYPQPPE